MPRRRPRRCGGCQGFAQEEDIAFKKIVADYEKASGNTIDYSIIPYAPERQKIVSAVTSGVVPDLFQNNPVEIVALFAWDDKLVDVSDVVETQKEEYTETALLTAYCYNNVEKKRSFYGVPYTIDAFTNHVWRSLVEKAGYKIEDIPKTWDAYYDFFKDVQKKLREQGVRNVYGLGFQVTTNGDDPNSTVQLFPDRLWRSEHRHQGRQTAPRRSAGARGGDQGADLSDHGLQGRLRAAERDQLERRRRQQRLSRQDDRDGSRRLALDRGRDHQEAAGLRRHRDDGPGAQQRRQAGAEQGRSLCGLIPKGAKNVAVAKEFLKYLIQPKVCNEYLKTGLGRRAPAMPSIVEGRPVVVRPKDPHRVAYTTQALLGPTVPNFWAFNPAYAQVQNEHVWQTAWADIMKDGMTPQAAAEKAFKRVEEIFAKYPIAQT